MMEAWLSSSEQMRTPPAPKTLRTPRLAAKPVGKTTARSAPLARASSSSSWAWQGRLPVTRRLAPAPVPQRSRASWAAATTAGWTERPR